MRNQNQGRMITIQNDAAIRLQARIRGNQTRVKTADIMKKITNNKILKGCRKNQQQYVKIQSMAPFRSRQALLYYDSNRNLLSSLQREFSNKHHYLTLYNLEQKLPLLLKQIINENKSLYNFKFERRPNKYEFTKKLLSLIKSYLPVITVKTKSYRYFSTTKNCCFEMNHDEIVDLVKQIKRYFYDVMIAKLLRHNLTNNIYMSNLIVGQKKEEDEIRKALRSVCKIIVLR